MVYHVTEYRERRDHLAWFACSEAVDGYETSRDAFLGAYRGWDRPIAVERGAMTGSIAHGWQPVGALRTALVLQPGETRDVTFTLGYAENPANRKFDPPGSRRPDTRGARAVIDRYRTGGQVETDLAALRAVWDERLGTLQVATGEPHVDRMVNTWNPYQCMVTFNLSRSASMFESGIGRGMGFRDSNQDLLGFVHMVPERARERILDTAATQLPDGGAYHQYQPLTKRGNDAVGSRVQRRPGVARDRRRGVPQGDGRPVDPRRARRSGTTPRARRRRSTTTCAGASRSRSTGWVPMGCRSSGGRTGTTASTSTCSRSTRATRSRRRPTGPAALPSPCSSPGCSCSPRARPRRSPGCGATTSKAARCRDAAAAMTDGDRGARLGRRLVPPGLRPRRARRRLERERRGPDLHRAPGADGDGRRGPRRRPDADRDRLGARAARDAARDRAPAAGVRELPPRARRDLLVPAGVQGERRRLLPHEPVDDDRGGDHWATPMARSTTTCGSTRRPGRRSRTSTAASRTSTRR